ncbi:hypothetical protein [Rhodanobacter sp. OR92]|uniref:hypothetical protein n=1 Tax=Rhodanobacter sp. OR92 TaxID=1076524 RepID=UPI000419001A|nr:hypothetical protein [Rhodanobacter sp. OR92]
MASSTTHATHTPGEWRAESWIDAPLAGATTVLVDDPSTVLGKRVIAHCQSEDAVADAQFIAEAPAMLSLVQAFVENIDEWDGEPTPGQRWHKEYVAARALLARVMRP